VLHAQPLEDPAVNKRENVRPADEFANPRGEQDPHARVLVLDAGSEGEGRADRLAGELRQRRMLLAQLVVIDELIGQAGSVRQQVTDRHIVSPISSECGQDFFTRSSS
jgi:hypothetical protein